MRVVVIGGTGHIGSYLVPRLVERGHEVIVLSRGSREPYLQHAGWKQVRRLAVDREAERRSGGFAARVAKLEPAVVMDLICFTPESARGLVQALRGAVEHYLCCGTIWVHGPSVVVPTTEEQPRRPFGDYGVNKAAMEEYLLREARLSGFPATVVHPGHIVGRGWVPLNPQGNFNPAVYLALARGQDLALPNLGQETVHHVHADDVAGVFIAAMESRPTALGESFHAVSPRALSLRGFAEQVAAWFGVEPSLRFLPWEEWKKTVSEEDARTTWDHIAHSPSCSMAKAERRLGFRPRHGSVEAVRESLAWLIEHGALRP
jgi:nucleoside-diphosphate-sugar epimerase